MAIDTTTLCADNGVSQDGILVLNNSSLSLHLTTDSSPQDEITWEVTPAESGITFSGSPEGSSVTLNVGQTPGVYTITVYVDDLPTCSDQITVKIGESQKIISYIADFNPNSVDILDVVDAYQEKTGRTLIIMTSNTKTIIPTIINGYRNEFFIF